MENQFIVNLQPGQNAFFIGDTHGDLKAFLSALSLTQQVHVPANVLRKTDECPVRQSQSSRDRFPLTPDEAQSVRWQGGRSIVLFLGDVVDNRRGGRADRFGVCAYTGTQYQMLDLLFHLKQQARASGGDVLLCLGNHEVENISSFQVSDYFCKNYAPAVQRASRDGEAYAVCDSRGFSAEHQARMLRAIQRLGVYVLVMVRTNVDAVLGCHGGLTDLSVYRKLNMPIQKGKAVENLTVINGIFQEALERKDPVALKFINKYQSKMPTWCRPKSILNGDDLKRYFGTSKMVKAHDVQDEPNCTHGPRARRFADGELCRIDTGMSRAFGKGEKAYCCLKVWANRKGYLQREILS